MANITVIHGPNMNLLGKRETELYGTIGLDNLNQSLIELADKAGHRVVCFQNNAEGEIINYIHALESCDMIIINPAALTHTSIALRDALLAKRIPFIEVHCSNVFARESFRHHSYLADIAVGSICGFGAHSYLLAYHATIHYLNCKKMESSQWTPIQN